MIMAQDTHYLAKIGARRCISLVALVFAIVLMVQYSEFPYGFTSSVSSNGETSVSTFSMVNNSTNFTNVRGLNSTDSSILLNVPSPSGGVGGKELVPKDKLISERNNETDISIEGEDVIDPEDETHFKNFTLGDDPLLSFTETGSLDNSSSSLDVLSNSNSSSMAKDAPSLPDNQSSISNFPPPMKKGPERKSSVVVSIADMNNLLLNSRASSFSKKPLWSLKVDNDLQMAKTQIENSSIVQSDYELYAPLFRNMSMFRRSYELMEEVLKVYIYKEGDRPIFHTPILKGIYASEGWFMKQLKSSKHYITKDPRKAHLFYLPFSSRMLEETLYVPNSHSHNNLVQHLKNYLDNLVQKYDFWNRTGGADHFLVACHDWAPSETRQLMAYCIRALCNADVKGFKFGKDVSLPQTYLRYPQNPLKNLGGKPPSQRKTLAFFAGSMHGYLRYELLKQWENKDPEMKIFGKMQKSTPKGELNYVQYMKSSKYCICAKGYEVNSPRVVEAIFYECVPVIISDGFVPPLFETLNWESFAVFVPEKEIPNLKKILSSISNKKYLEMQKGVKKVQQHFLWHGKPVKYDIFHMILHSIWFNRIFSMHEE